MDLLNSTFAQFVSSLEGATTVLMVYGLKILAGAAFLYASWYLIQGSHVMSSGAGLSDVLASFLLLAMGIGIYTWIMTNWAAIAAGALEAIQTWAGAGGGNAELLTSPASLWELGDRAAAPIGLFSEWERGVASLTSVATNPLTFVCFLVIKGAFAWLVFSFGMALVEWGFAAACGAIFLPLSYVVPLRHLGESMVGWLCGVGIRIFVLVALAAIAVPLLEGLAPPPSAVPVPPSGSFVGNIVGGIMTSGMPNLGPSAAPKIGQTLTLTGGALLFALLAGIIPGRAARLAAGASLGLGASDVVAGAMAAGRFGMLLGRSLYSPIRGSSQLLHQMRPR